MRKIVIAILGVVLAVSMLGSGVARAQWDDDYSDTDYYDDYYDDYDYSDYESAAEGAAGLGILGGVMGLVIGGCAFIIGIANFVVWVISLIHAIQHAPSDQKTLWILLIVFIPFANWVYFFTKRKLWGPAKVAAAAEA
ncbi:MAG: PLDc N-terminal domain-containing protein [Patescibacteria group bacterium]|nr:PLDc N-terminal domain-containing protein [Patescibacteria group bacterium]